MDNETEQKMAGRWTSSYPFVCLKSVVLTKAADGEKTKPEVLCRDGMSKHLYGASLQMAPQMFSRFVATLSIVIVRDWKAKVEERETTKTGKNDDGSEAKG